MFNELLDVVKQGLKQFFTSRFLALGIIFIVMFGALVLKLFDLQIVKSEDYQESYIQKTEKEVLLAATRGRILDRNGNVLADNQLVYSITYTDTGSYSDGYDRNEMLIRLIEILDKHDEEIVSAYPMIIDENGELAYATTSESEFLGLFRDFYSVEVSELGTKDYPTDLTARELFEKEKVKFGIGYYKEGDSRGKTYEIDDATALKLLNMRYAMYQKSYMRYEAIVLASDVSMETVMDVSEHMDELMDIDIGEETIRYYNDAEYFSSIIGYTGKASEEELETLQEEDDTYVSGDIVGKTGMEQAMEDELSGTKGSKTMYLDSQGHILEETSLVESAAGNDIYLSVDRDLTIAVYSLLEQKLAGILCERIVTDEIYDDDYKDIEDTSKIHIRISTAYFQLINNNVISMSKLAEEDASAIEQTVYQKFQTRMEEVLATIEQHLTAADSPAFEALDDDNMKDYMNYLFDNNVYLSLPDEVESDETYTAWKAGTISLQEFLYYAVSQNWIDISKLDVEGKYSNTDKTYAALVEAMLNDMRVNTGFGKIVYRCLIDDGAVTGNELGMILYEQGLLVEDDETYQSLISGDKSTAYNFMIDKIKSLELTPAQLALDPCNASCVITDPQTGELLALVSYPGYDNNRLSGNIDSEYYVSLLNNESKPLFNFATQGRTAPGSVFKMVTAVAALETGVVKADELIHDEGEFKQENLNLKCWIYPGSHGDITIQQAIEQSCNFFFSTMGYRLGLISEDTFSYDYALKQLRNYAEIFGFGSKSGIEIGEYEPSITTDKPIPAAIGQGSHTFANVHLSRYVTAIASTGNLYEYTLLNKIASSDGTIIKEVTPNVELKIDISDTSWSVIQNGMLDVTSQEKNGTVKTLFEEFNEKTGIKVAGKTGTAEESTVRGPHANFVCYAPFENPEIAISVAIPYGYNSSSATGIAIDVMNYYFGYTTLDDVLNDGAKEVTKNVSE